jgi:uncharacterized membrane protein YgdD (TMEM256/DUF423 family)
MRLARAALVAGAIGGGLAVVLGAFGAHALRGVLDERALAIWHTGVEYQFWHALALLVIGTLARSGAGKSLRIAAVAFVLGVVMFSGSLYVLALGGPGAVGFVTPIGGVSLIAGWGALLMHAWCSALR